MSDFTELYPLLNSQNQKEVDDFVEFLFKKQFPTDEEVFDWKKFKEKLLKISVWEEDSLKAIENVGKSSKFKIESW